MLPGWSWKVVKDIEKKIVRKWEEKKRKGEKKRSKEKNILSSRWIDYTMYSWETDRQMDKAFHGIQGHIQKCKKKIQI